MTSRALFLLDWARIAGRHAVLAPSKKKRESQTFFVRRGVRAAVISKADPPFEATTTHTHWLGTARPNQRIRNEKIKRARKRKETRVFDAR